MVLAATDLVFRAPSWRPNEPSRTLIELRQYVELRHSQANLWRYPPGAHGRRHREPVQEEVFCVVQGTLTVLLGDPAERHNLPPICIVVVKPDTAVQLRNESGSDVLVFAYGAPQQPADYKAGVLAEVD